MDKLNLLVTMAQQGMTTEQIRAAMDAAFPMKQPAQVQTTGPIQQHAQVQTPGLIQQPAQVQTPGQIQQPDFSALTTKMDELIGAIRSGAVINSNQPRQETADDVLGLMMANIIPPAGGDN